MLRYWQTRTHSCGHIVADTNVSPFARARNICCGYKFCVRDTKNVSDFGQKHFLSATNVSQFAQHAIYHEQQCVCNNMSSFAGTLISFGIDLSHKIVGNKTPHNSKNPPQGKKNRYPIFRPIKLVS